MSYRNNAERRTRKRQVSILNLFDSNKVKTRRVEIRTREVQVPDLPAQEADVLLIRPPHLVYCRLFIGHPQEVAEYVERCSLLVSPDLRLNH